MAEIPNCRVFHPLEKRWSIDVRLDIEQLQQCYPRENKPSTADRLHQAIVRPWDVPRRVYEDSGLQQSKALREVMDKIHTAIHNRYGDFLDTLVPFEFENLIFVFNSALERPEDSDGPIRFVDRVMC